MLVIGGPCDVSVSPSPFGLDFGLWTIFLFGFEDIEPGCGATIVNVCFFYMSKSKIHQKISAWYASFSGQLS